jgi:hypothetical protein
MSPAHAKIARQKARDENTSNNTPLEASGYSSKLWKSGRILHVTFLEGNPTVQHKVVSYANQWSKYANVTFLFGNHPNAEIRITFQPDGSWSALGTDALVEERFPKGTPTMNFGWLTLSTPEDEYSAVVLHEFGHALGLIHEHQSPAGSIKWNYETVTNDLSGYPYYWDAAAIQANIFTQYDESQTQYSQFDPKSIMLYPLPQTWTHNTISFPKNTVLSHTDMQFIQKLYPQ